MLRKSTPFHIVCMLPKCCARSFITQMCQVGPLWYRTEEQLINGLVYLEHTDRVRNRMVLLEEVVNMSSGGLSPSIFTHPLTTASRLDLPQHP